MVKNENNTQTQTQDRPTKKGVFVLMSEAQHRHFKVQAAETGTTLQNIVSALLNEAISKTAPSDGRRGNRRS